MRDELFRLGREDGVPAGVVAVVMRVEGQVDAASASALPLQAVDTELRGVGELRVDGDQRLFVGEPSDGAAARREIADVAANGFESRLRGRRL